MPERLSVCSRKAETFILKTNKQTSLDKVHFFAREWQPNCVGPCDKVHLCFFFYKSKSPTLEFILTNFLGNLLLHFPFSSLHLLSSSQRRFSRRSRREGSPSCGRRRRFCPGRWQRSSTGSTGTSPSSASWWTSCVSEWQSQNPMGWSGSLWCVGLQESTLREKEKARGLFWGF